LAVSVLMVVVVSVAVVVVAVSVGRLRPKICHILWCMICSFC
jgi:hypothetical protein